VLSWLRSAAAPIGPVAFLPRCAAKPGSQGITDEAKPDQCQENIDGIPTLGVVRAHRAGLSFGTAPSWRRPPRCLGQRRCRPKRGGWWTSALMPACRVRQVRTSILSANRNAFLAKPSKPPRQGVISTKATFRFGEGPNDLGSSRQHLLAPSMVRSPARHPTIAYSSSMASMRPRRPKKCSRRLMRSYAPARSAMSASRTSPAGTFEVSRRC